MIALSMAVVGYWFNPMHWAERWLAADFVLSRYTAEERSAVDDVVRRAAQGLVDWAGHGIEYCMNQYN